jgi:NRPS condensation-like uncharacterized protein
MKWETRKKNIVPGIARFQKIENVANKRVFFRVDKGQFDAIKSYCSKYNVTMTDLILSSVYATFEAKNFEPGKAPGEDPNQIKMF